MEKFPGDFMILSPDGLIELLRISLKAVNDDLNTINEENSKKFFSKKEKKRLNS